MSSTWPRTDNTPTEIALMDAISQAGKKLAAAEARIAELQQTLNEAAMHIAELEAALCTIRDLKPEPASFPASRAQVEGCLNVLRSIAHVALPPPPAERAEQ